MKCEQARRLSFMTSFLPVKFFAGRHLRACPQCSQWRAGLSKMEALLAAASRHEAPARMRERLRGDIRQADTAPDFLVPPLPAVRPRAAALLGAAALIIMVGALCVWALVGKFGGGIAWAQMSEALSQVNVVHITGFVANKATSNIPGDPLYSNKDKWLRREPAAFREEMRATDLLGEPGGDLLLIVLSDAEQATWYFPGKNSVSYTKPVALQFIEELTRLQGWERHWQDSGRLPRAQDGLLNGEPVTIVRLPAEPALFGDDATIRLYIDRQTYLVLRAEAYKKVARGKVEELMRFDFEYDAPLPEGIFEFISPEGVKIIDKRSPGRE